MWLFNVKTISFYYLKDTFQPPLRWLNDPTSSFERIYIMKYNTCHSCYNALIDQLDIFYFTALCFVVEKSNIMCISIINDITFISQLKRYNFVLNLNIFFILTYKLIFNWFYAKLFKSVSFFKSHKRGKSHSGSNYRY